MEYTDFIAVIDLGTSHIVGMVGTKNQNDVLSIIAYDAEKSEACVRRGCVYNVGETANKVNRLVRKLENKLGGKRIGRLYIGVGGQSIRTIDHTVSKLLGNGGEVTAEILRQLEDECRNYHPSLSDVLDVADPVYLLDGKEENNPLNLTCSKIEARYKLIIGKPAIKTSIMTNLAERISVPVAGILVSPLALADMLLSPAEKQNAILLNFGAGVTSVTIFKNGRLLSLSVVPFGSHLITTDIMTALNVSESDAERLKRTYGSALPLDYEKESEKIEISKVDSYQMQEISLCKLNEIVEARSREITENVFARLEDSGISKDLTYTVTISGSGILLKNLQEVINKRLKMPVHYPAIQKGLMDGPSEMIANNPENATAVALLLKGKGNCEYKIEQKINPEPVKQEPAEPVRKPEPVVNKEPEPIKKPERKDPNVYPDNSGKKHNIFGKLGNKFRGTIESTAGNLFNDENL